MHSTTLPTGNAYRYAVENFQQLLKNISQKQADHKLWWPEIFDKCIYIALYNHFTFYLSKYQNGFKKHRSFLLNMLSFLKKTHEALDSDPDSEIVAFYTDFSKAFDKVPHHKLIQKVAQIRVGGCLLGILINHLENRKLFEKNQQL